MFWIIVGAAAGVATIVGGAAYLLSAEADTVKTSTSESLSGIEHTDDAATEATDTEPDSLNLEEDENFLVLDVKDTLEEAPTNDLQVIMYSDDPNEVDPALVKATYDPPLSYFDTVTLDQNSAAQVESDYGN